MLDPTVIVTALSSAGIGGAIVGGVFSWLNNRTTAGLARQRDAIADSQATEILQQEEIRQLRLRVMQLELRIDGMNDERKREIEHIRDQKHAAANVAQRAVMQNALLRAWLGQCTCGQSKHLDEMKGLMAAEEPLINAVTYAASKPTEPKP